MTTLIPEANLGVEEAEKQPGEIKPIAGLPPQELNDLQSGTDLAVLLSHDMLSCATKVEGVVYLLGELPDP